MFVRFLARGSMRYSARNSLVQSVDCSLSEPECWNGSRIRYFERWRQYCCSHLGFHSAVAAGSFRLRVKSVLTFIRDVNGSLKKREAVASTKPAGAGGGTRNVESGLPASGAWQ